MKKHILFVLLLLLSLVTVCHAEQFWVGSVYTDSVSGFVPNIQTFDWAASGSGNMQGMLTSGVSLPPGTPLTLRYQSKLAGASAPSGASVNLPGLNSAFEYTVVAQLPVQVVFYDATNKMYVFSTLAGGTFAIYHDAQPNSNVLSGYGFDDGDLVASGDIYQNQPITSTQGVGSTILNCKVTSADAAFLDPAPTIVSFRLETTVNSPPLDSITSAYFAGREGQGSLPTYNVTANDAAFKFDASSKFGSCSGSIGDFVWNDLNRDGIQTSGEEGIANVTLNLLDAAGNILRTTTTGPDGSYLFNGLCAGAYSVDVVEATLPSGATPTIMEAGDNRAVDSNGNSDGSPVTVTLPTDNSSDLTIDFGYVTPCTGSIGDLVWHDLNRNGIQDNGEPGIQSVVVTLMDASGTPLATTATDANGLYAFSGLCAGTYMVGVAAPAGYSATTALVGSNRAVDSNENPTLVTLPANDTTDTTIDFGFITPCTGTIGDFIWHDTNRNGIQDAGEPGIDGVTVNLQNAGGAVIATTTSGIGPMSQNGYYQFTGLCGGDYAVLVVETTLPAGYTATTSNVGTDRSVDSNGSPATVTLPTDNSSNQTIDFGYISPCSGAIGDFVWHDMNRNGIQDAGEPGINDVTVNLLNAAGASIQTATTSAGGLYLFTGLCPGNYSVVVDATTLPAGYTPTTANATGSDMTNDSNGSPAPVSLTEGEQNRTIDFGYVNLCEGAIGDFVWHDMNRNGIQDDANAGMDGITIKLQDANGTVIKTTSTGSGPMSQHGYYQFTALCAGNYTVVVDSSTLPPGYTATMSNAGSDEALDSNGSPAPVNLPTDNSSDQTIDFGYISPCTGTIGDFVWDDVNKNGIQDAGEQGIGGVTVLLKNPADNTTYATTTTDANGYYLFNGLCGGSYKVEVNESTLPVGFVPTLSNVGTNRAIDSNGSPAPVTLPNDSSDLTIDFGYYMSTGTGCSLTWGYWKTHSEFGPAPYDNTWALLPIGASTPFFISGQTWYQVLQTDRRGGSAYYILAHQYIAAYLNLLNGADVSVISSQLAQAKALLESYKPSDVLSSSTRSTFVSIAYTLDQYNNGNIGPGHCNN